MGNSQNKPPRQPSQTMDDARAKIASAQAAVAKRAADRNARYRVQQQRDDALSQEPQEKPSPSHQQSIPFNEMAEKNDDGDILVPDGQGGWVMEKYL